MSLWDGKNIYLILPKIEKGNNDNKFFLTETTTIIL